MAPTHSARMLLQRWNQPAHTQPSHSPQPADWSPEQQSLDSSWFTLFVLVINACSPCSGERKVPELSRQRRATVIFHSHLTYSPTTQTSPPGARREDPIRALWEGQRITMRRGWRSESEGIQ